MPSTTVLCSLTAVAQEAENMLHNYLHFINPPPPIRECLPIHMELYFYCNLNGSMHVTSGGYSSDPR